MKKTLLQMALLASVFTPYLVSAGTTVSIDADGKTTVAGLKVVQIAGPTLFTRMTWGDAYVRLTVKAGEKTEILRGTGEKTTVSEIVVGDVLNIDGVLESGGNTMTLIPKKIIDISIQKNQAVMSGTVTNVNISDNKVYFLTKKNEVVTMLASSTILVQKGSRLIAPTSIVAGDKLTEVVGEYDRSTKTIVANKVTVYLDKSLYKAKQFKAKLVSIPTAENTAQMNVKIAGSTYKVQLSNDTKILNSLGKPTTFNRFDVGDDLVVSGARQESDDLIINATSVKNISL